MLSAAQCFEKSADFAKRARSAPSTERQAILYGMGWLWMTLSRHAELRETAFSADEADKYKGQCQSAQD
jgi:hypothetical protein